MSNRDQFISMYTPAAQRVAQQLNVPVDGVLNHWGLETGWGKSVIPGTNNLGNIKDFSGGGVAATDNMTKTRDKYRTYASPDDFANDYAKLIGTNPRYAHALNTSTAYDFANGLQRGGYAEDPNFARKVAGLPIGSNQMDVNQPRLVRTAAAYGLPVTDASLGEIKASKIPPEALAQIQAMQQERASMLPLSLGGMISSNRGAQNFGNNLFGEARKAMNPIQTDHGMMIGDQYITDDSSAALKQQAANLQNAQRQQIMDQRDDDNRPANYVADENGNYVIDPNAPWKGLRQKESMNMRNQVMKKADAEIAEMRKAYGNDTTTNQMLEQFSNLNKREGTGGAWDKLAPDWMHTGDTSAMIALQNKLTPLQRPAGSGATSDFEQKLYKLGTVNIGNTGNVNAQIRMATQALTDVRAARLAFYEDYLAKYGHLNGAEREFAPRIKAIEDKYAPMIAGYGDVDEKGRQTAEAKRRNSQVSNLPMSKAKADPSSMSDEERTNALLNQYK